MGRKSPGSTTSDLTGGRSPAAPGIPKVLFRTDILCTQWYSHKAQPSLAPEDDIGASVSGVHLAWDGKRRWILQSDKMRVRRRERQAFGTRTSQQRALSFSRASSGNQDKPQAYCTSGNWAPDVLRSVLLQKWVKHRPCPPAALL